jgi:hypothetical protein
VSTFSGQAQPEENKGGGCLSTSLVIGIIILCLVTTFYRPYSPGVIIRIIGFGDTRTSFLDNEVFLFLLSAIGYKLSKLVSGAKGALVNINN